MMRMTTVMNPSGRLMAPEGTWLTAAMRRGWPCEHTRHHLLVFRLQMTFEMQSKSSFLDLLPDLHSVYAFPRGYTQEHSMRSIINIMSNSYQGFSTSCYLYSPWSSLNFPRSASSLPFMVKNDKVQFICPGPGSQ